MSQLIKASWNWVVIGLLIGFASGAIFGKWYARENFLSHKGKTEIKQHILKKLDRKLHLTESQKKQISAIFDESHPKMTALHEEMRPKFEALRNQTDAKIRMVLNPEQQKKFDEMLSEMEKRWKEHKDRFGP